MIYYWCSSGGAERVNPMQACAHHFVYLRKEGKE